MQKKRGGIMNWLKIYDIEKRKLNEEIFERIYYMYEILDTYYWFATDACDCYLVEILDYYDEYEIPKEFFIKFVSATRKLYAEIESERSAYFYEYYCLTEQYKPKLNLRFNKIMAIAEKYCKTEKSLKSLKRRIDYDKEHYWNFQFKSIDEFIYEINKKIDVLCSDTLILIEDILKEVANVNKFYKEADGEITIIEKNITSEIHDKSKLFVKEKIQNKIIENRLRKIHDYKEMEQLAIKNGYYLKRSRGSHRTYENEITNKTVTIPANKLGTGLSIKLQKDIYANSKKIT